MEPGIAIVILAVIIWLVCQWAIWKPEEEDES